MPSVRNCVIDMPSSSKMGIWQEFALFLLFSKQHDNETSSIWQSGIVSRNFQNIGDSPRCWITQPILTDGSFTWKPYIFTNEIPIRQESMGTTSRSSRTKEDGQAQFLVNYRDYSVRHMPEKQCLWFQQWTAFSDLLMMRNGWMAEWLHHWISMIWIEHFNSVNIQWWKWYDKMIISNHDMMNINVNIHINHLMTCELKCQGAGPRGGSRLPPQRQRLRRRCRARGHCGGRRGSGAAAGGADESQRMVPGGVKILRFWGDLQRFSRCFAGFLWIFMSKLVSEQNCQIYFLTSNFDVLLDFHWQIGS